MFNSSGEEAANKRQRVSRACDLCRRKKIRCDGFTPVCGNCRAFNLECSYKDMTKKRGPPKGYIEAVENRLKKLEALLADMTKDKDDPKSKAVLAELNAPLETPTGEVIKARPVRRANRGNKRSAPAMEGSSSHPFSSTPTTATNRMSSPHESPMSLSQICFAETSGQTTHQHYYPDDSTPSSPDSAADSTGQLSMDENGQMRYLGKSSGYYLLQKSRTYQNGAFHFTGWGHRTTPRRKSVVSQLDPLELPPKDLSEHLLQIYFKHFYPLLPIFYKKRLYSSLASPLEPVSPLLLNAIYAVASRVSPDVRVRSDPSSPDTAGDIFFERAKCLLDNYYDIPKVSTVQALLLMAIHQHGTMKYVRAWLYSGMAFRMAQDLGLHRNCEHWNIPPEERERRKRVFWCCFILDRLTSAIYGRSSTFEERDCDVPFPSVDDDEEIQQEDIEGEGDNKRPPVKILEAFVHLVKICDILGHVLRNVYYAKARHHASAHHFEHVLNGLNRELTNWFNNLPPSLQYRPPNTESGETCRDPPSPVSQMHMIYYTTIILLHRPFIPAHSSSPLSLPSFKICISAATSILDIVNVMLSEGHLKYVMNYAVYCVFTAGIVFIKMASSDDADKAFDAKIYINKIMRALDEIEMTWMNAARCCNILGELAGLREINLECDEYVPRRNSRVANPPPSISVPNLPNSPEIRAKSEEYSSRPTQQQQQPWSSNDRFEQDMSQQQQQRSGFEPEGDNKTCKTNEGTLSTSRAFYTNEMGVMNKTAATMDPFAAPGVVPYTQQQYDPLHTAFWGVPSSLDVEEWNNYFGMQNMSNQQQQQQQLPSSNSSSSSNNEQQQPPSIMTSAAAQQPLIPSHEFSPMQPQTRGFIGEPQPIPMQQGFRQQRPTPSSSRNHLVHSDNNVDMLTGVSLPLSLPESPASSVLLGLLANPESSNTSNGQATN